MEEPKYKGQHVVSKQKELEESWEININQGVWNADMEDHHTRFLWLHLGTMEDYKENRAEYKKLQLEITRQQERRKQAAN